MGFGTLAANIIVFIAILMLASGLIIVMNVYVQETRESLTDQKNRLVEEIRTDITIQSVHYNNSEITLYVINSGKTNLPLTTIDIFLEGRRVPRNERTIEIEPDTLIGSANSWDPREIIKVTINEEITTTTLIRISADNGAVDQDIISI